MEFLNAYRKEFDHEAISTRKMLERIPAEKFDWAPHQKSMKLGSLANHITNFPRLVRIVLSNSEFDARSPEAIASKPAPSSTATELLDQWDRQMEDMRLAIAEVSDEQLAESFTLKFASQTAFTMPRKVALRSFILNHLIHHRGQLSVYLRLLDISVPSIYGASADEK